METTSNQWQQERLFASSGPFIHLYTSPLETDVLAENDDDRTVILNMIALVSHEMRTDVLAYALMSNHIHLILQGDEVSGKRFFELLSKRLARYLATRGKAGCLSRVACGMTAITSLKQFRDEVAYVIRNPYVVRDDINPFSYRWCSGYLYFNRFLSRVTGQPAEKISFRERRKITRSTSGELPSHFKVDGMLILPESYVNYKLVEGLFGTARQYLFWTMKNIEAQVEVARSIGEMPHLTDDEMFRQSRVLCKSMFGMEKPQELDGMQKKELAMSLRNKYHASNGQLARFTNLPLMEVNQMYPLTAKR